MEKGLSSNCTKYCLSYIHCQKNINMELGNSVRILRRLFFNIKYIQNKWNEQCPTDQKLCFSDRPLNEI